MKSELDPKAMYWATFNNFELRLPGAAVLEIAQSGHNDEAVAAWVDRVEFMPDIWGRPRATPERIRGELREYGAWSEDELADDEQNRHRIVWLAAWDISESDKPDCSAPLVLSGEVGPFRNISI